MHSDTARRDWRYLKFEGLEVRSVPATAALAAGALTVTGTAGDDRIRVFADGAAIRVLDGTADVGRFDAASVSSIAVDTGGGRDTVIVDPNLAQQVVLSGGAGADKLVAGGGPSTLIGGGERDALFGGANGNNFDGGDGANDLFNVFSTDVVIPNPRDRVLVALPPGTTAPKPKEVLTADEVDALLKRASAASASNDAIIVVTDRNGDILGVRVESGVATEITSDLSNLVFAVDGAYSKALTAAYFANDQGPLTSRTVQNLSQTTITEREVESNPNVTDPNSTVRGPGFVAPVGTGGHFPPEVPNTPQVDLFAIEHTNRDGTFHVGEDAIKGTADDVELAQRFNIDPNFVPAGQDLTPPDSYGFQSGLMPGAQSRGIATLPGGVPIYKNGQMVGGIGVFFPGKTGYATEENSSLSETFDSTKPDRSLEAEWIAFAAVGGTRSSIGGAPTTPVGDLGGVALPAGFGLPAGRIDLVGIQLDVYGPGGSVEGSKTLLAVGNTVGRGNPNDGTNLAVDPGTDGTANTADDVFLQGGAVVPEGWLVVPHDGVGITAEEVSGIVTQALVQQDQTRAAIRLPIGTRAKFVIAVADKEGNVVGLYRSPDATVFSIDVAVAKARNANYYADPDQLQDIDQIDGIPPGTAFTGRTFRNAAQPRFPQGIDGAAPGPMSQLNDDPLGTNRLNGLQTGAPLPASGYQSVLGYDAFNPGTNFRQDANTLNQNGIVFFPGSSALYRDGALIGGLGVSGDGVDQDDVVTVSAQSGFGAPLEIRADQYKVRGVRLVYQKFNRNPEG